MSWRQDIDSILQREPELWLDYFAGLRASGKIDNYKKYRPTLPFFVPKALAFLILIVGKLLLPRIKRRRRAQRARFFVLATSRNQMHATLGTLGALKKKNESLLAISKKKRLKSALDREWYYPLSYTATDLLRGWSCFLRYGPSLHRNLKAHYAHSAQSYFLEIAKVYLYLAYFYRILNETNPEFAITSNDHSAINRCMLATARHLNVKTVYIQHASVSPLFPALLFDYAFLDGPSAAETYEQCENNRPPGPGPQRQTRVILSGQKKKLTIRAKPARPAVGIAINKLDNIEPVVQIAKSLAGTGFEIVMRWHPRQSSRDVRLITKALGKVENVTLSSPETEDIDNFLNRLKWLIAGNSSIHLEAAIKGVVPIYYEFSPVSIPDYYGYVKHGLAILADSQATVLALLTTAKTPKVNPAAVRYYSATFETEWEGQEGELVATWLVDPPNH